MPVKEYKATSPALRYMTVTDFSCLSKKSREKSLSRSIKKHAGRSRGTIAVRHQGGAGRKIYRLVDFKRSYFDQPAQVIALEYDPNRSAFIALVQYGQGQKSYILAPEGLKEGMEVMSSRKKISPRIGNRMPLKYVPEGGTVYNVELRPGAGGQIIRSAGAMAEVMSSEGRLVNLKMPSGEVRQIEKDCLGTIGQVSNSEHGNLVVGKAGRKRKMGIRPTVRGKAMNPVDHPHGGGEARNSIGLVHPKTKWGRPALGVKTRKNKKASDKFIVRRRK